MASAGTAPAPVRPQQPVEDQRKINAAAQVARGARWFYWIAGLSLVNSAIGIFGGGVHFVIGLGITQVFDVLTKPFGGTGIVLDVVINGTVAAVVCLFGVFASKGQKWAFLVGMVLYGMDGLLLLLGGDYFSVAFHAYAIYAISRGLSAAE